MTNQDNTISTPLIGITVGDINGIGPEVIIKSLLNTKIVRFLTPVIYASGKIFSYYRKKLDLQSFHYHQCTDVGKIIPGKINLIQLGDEAIEITPGQPSKIAGSYALKSLEAAVADHKQGKIDAITTAPLSKELIQSKTFHFPGHTEYLTAQAGAKESLMFLVSDRLRVGVATGHIPLREVSDKLSQDLIRTKVEKMIRSLQQDFGIKKPRIAILGLNPHAGENGLLGKEEEEVIIPAIQDLKEKHIIMGPFPSDGFFGQGTFHQYDGILAMYHDQGLIPFKTMAFDEGVNFTAGLSFIRTSPDHGTAFDIAGKNQANETSFRNALYLARDIVHNRKQNANLSF